VDASSTAPIAFDDDGGPSFNALQNYGSATAPVVYYVFDVMVLAGRDVTRETLETRRELLEQKVLPKVFGAGPVYEFARRRSPRAGAISQGTGV
jgi:bifunctional non-homologous end joining protein LigD